MTSEQGKRWVVIGGGIAGLLAATPCSGCAKSWDSRTPSCPRRVSCLDLALPTRSIGDDVTVGEVASAAGLMGLAAIVAADAADDFS